MRVGPAERSVLLYEKNEENEAMRNAILTTALSAAAIALAGTALAGAGQFKAPSAGGDVVAQAAPPAGSPQATPPARSPDTGAAGGAAAKPAAPPDSIIGKDLVTADGKKVGEIDKIEGDQVIVSVGGFLGLGSHDVALPWKELTMTGSGDDAKLLTSMSEKELKELPEYKAPEPARSSPGGGGMGGTGRTGGTGGMR